MLNRSSSDTKLYRNSDEAEGEVVSNTLNRILDVGKFATLNNRRKKFEQLTTRRKREWLTKRNDHGFIRLYTPSGQRSLTVPVTTQTIVRDVCQSLKIQSVFFQIGNQHIRQLSAESRPLQIQNEILLTLGYPNVEQCLQIGDASHLKHIFCFYIGRPEFPTSNVNLNELLVVNCLVRRGRLLQRWSRRRCILYNGTLRIERGGSSDEKANGLHDEDKIVMLNRFKVDVAESNHGKCLRLISNNQQICLAFDDPSELQKWTSHALQCQMVPNCDLSDKQLLFLPDQLFYVGSQRMITSLNLRRNSLMIKPTNTTGSPLIGWLDDISRFPSLRVLNLADNCLHTFPTAIFQLTALMDLNLSGNRISILPANIKLLTNLVMLNLSNNWLSSLPTQLTDCTHINLLDLSFNRFEQVPDVLLTMKMLKSWELAGNYIRNIKIDTLNPVTLVKLDLRLNALEQSLRLTSFSLNFLTVLDLRNGGTISDIDLSNISTIQVLNCEHLCLKILQINGSNLRELHANHNCLKQLIVMPIPANLTILNVAYNELEFLPEWITDISKIVTISAHHNKLKKLPYRIMMNVASLRHLLVGNNNLTKLPEVVENCSIEVINMENNQIEQLPKELLKSAHRLRHLNLTNNRLTELPSANSYTELNRLQTLRLAANLLTESIMPTIVLCRRLRLLDLSYNQLRFFNDSALTSLESLEELNLSGNRLTSLSGEIAHLPQIQVLRAHSNRIACIPDLSFSKSLRIIDLSNNRLEKIHTEYCISPCLKFLDLTCNPFCNTTKDFWPISEKRAVSIVDISRKCSLSNIQFGFSETTGQRSKLCIKQIRPTNSQNMTFAMVDGGSNFETVELVRNKLRHFLQLHTCDNIEMLRRSILHTHEHLGSKGERLGASCLVLRITDRQILCASSGHISALLVRRDSEVVYLAKELMVTSSHEYERIRRANAIITQGELINGVASSGTAVGFSFLFPAVIPNPSKQVVDLTEEEDFIIIGNRSLWHILTEQEIIEAVRQANAQQATKKLQDLVQANEHIGNLSLIVIRFNRQERFFEHDKASTKCSLQKIGSTVVPIANDRSFSENRVQTNTLRHIEERLEQISEAIRNIDDPIELTGGGLQNKMVEYRKSSRKTVRRLKEASHRSIDSRLSSSRPGSSFSYSSEVTEFDLNQSQNTIPSDPEINTSRDHPSLQLPSSYCTFSSEKDLSMKEKCVCFSEEHFRQMRSQVAKELRLETLKINPYNVIVKNIHDSTKK